MIKALIETVFVFLPCGLEIMLRPKNRFWLWKGRHRPVLLPYFDKNQIMHRTLHGDHLRNVYHHI